MGKQRRNVPQQRGRNAFGVFQDRMAEQFELKQRFQTDFLLQAGCDAFMLAAADVFDMTPEQAKDAITAYREYIMQMMDALIEDGKDDDELVYYWADLDRRLKQVVGEENFAAHEERYDETGIRIFGELCKRMIGKILKFDGREAEHG